MYINIIFLETNYFLFADEATYSRILSYFVYDCMKVIYFKRYNYYYLELIMGAALIKDIDMMVG